MKPRFLEIDYDPIDGRVNGYEVVLDGTLRLSHMDVFEAFSAQDQSDLYAAALEEARNRDWSERNNLREHRSWLARQ